MPNTDIWLYSLYHTISTVEVLNMILYYSSVCFAAVAVQHTQSVSSVHFLMSLAPFDSIRHSVSCAKFPVFSAVFYLAIGVSRLPHLDSEQAVFSGTVSMETCNYPRHQQFMLNNFINDQMGTIAAASPHHSFASYLI